VDMGVQNNPETVMYCALTNGTMACLSREIDHEVSAWSKHTTDGTYTSVAVIPSQSYDYDEVWYVVERWVNGSQRKYVEFFENIEVPDRQDQCFYVHSGLTYNAYASSSTSNVTISLDATSGSITVTSSSAYFNQAMVDDGEKIRVIDEDGDTIGEGTITATTNTSSVTITSTTDFSTTSYNAGRWGVSVNTIFGLDHLEAKTLSILADGETESKTRTVASGKVTLGDSYFVITAGLSYDQIVYTLPKEMSMGRGVSNRGTAVGKWQRFNEITLNMNRSTQNFEYGIDADNLDDINLAFTPTVTSLYTGILPPQGGGIAMRGGFRRGDQIYLKNSEPLPIEILNIVGTLNTNDR